MWNTLDRLPLQQKQGSEIWVSSASNVNTVSKSVQRDHKGRENSDTPLTQVILQAWGTWLSFVPLNWFLSLSIWSQPSIKGMLDAWEVWEWQLYSYQIRTANWPRKNSMSTDHWGNHSRFPLTAKAMSHFSFFLGKQKGHANRCGSFWHSSLCEFYSSLTQFWDLVKPCRVLFKWEKWHLQNSLPEDCTLAN